MARSEWSSERISRALTSFAHYEKNRPQGLYVDTSGTFSFSELMTVWGFRMGLEKQQVAHALMEHCFRDQNKTSRRFSTSHTADRGFVVHVHPRIHKVEKKKISGGMHPGRTGGSKKQQSSQIRGARGEREGAAAMSQARGPPASRARTGSLLPARRHRGKRGGKRRRTTWQMPDENGRTGANSIEVLWQPPAEAVVGKPSSAPRWSSAEAVLVEPSSSPRWSTAEADETAAEGRAVEADDPEADDDEPAAEDATAAADEAAEGRAVEADDPEADDDEPAAEDATAAADEAAEFEADVLVQPSARPRWSSVDAMAVQPSSRPRWSSAAAVVVKPSSRWMRGPIGGEGQLEARASWRFS